MRSWSPLQGRFPPAAQSEGEKDCAVQAVEQHNREARTTVGPSGLGGPGGVLGPRPTTAPPELKSPYPVVSWSPPAVSLGLLKCWAQSTDGRWFGRVNFKVTDAYGAEAAEHVSVLVPAHALRPRESKHHK